MLDAAMRFPDKQVGLCVAAMVSCGLAAGFRSDDLQDTGYFMELICSVPAEPLPMQNLALASNAGKANQDAQTTYAALANHRQPHLDCLAYLSQLVLYQINVSKLPLLALIYQNNVSWRSYRMFFRDPSMATSKQTYYDLSTMLLKVAATMHDTFVKTKLDLIVPFVQVINAELEWNARPLSPQMTEALDKISKQVCFLSEQIAHLQLHSQTAANLSIPTTSSSNTQARAARSPRIELEAQVGLSSGLSSVQEAVDE
ncbi:hypothetical protein ABBQ32_007711 [Trebouxia sp. C0010 RCD-2024]